MYLKLGRTQLGGRKNEDEVFKKSLLKRQEKYTFLYKKLVFWYATIFL